MQRSVSDSESAPNTVTKRHKTIFGNVPLHSKALCNACLLQLIPGLGYTMVLAHARCDNARAVASALLYAHAQNHGITDLSYFICMYVDRLHQEIFHAESLGLSTTICDKSFHRPVLQVLKQNAY